MGEGSSTISNIVANLVGSFKECGSPEVVEFLLHSLNQREPLHLELLVELMTAQFQLEKYHEAWGSALRIIEVDPTNELARGIADKLQNATRHYKIDGTYQAVQLVHADEFIQATPGRGASILITELRTGDQIRPLRVHRLKDALVVGGEGGIFDPKTASLFINSFASSPDTLVDFRKIQPNLTIDITQTIRIPGEVAHLCGQWSGNFFHWVNECLPRVHLLRKSGFDGWYLIPAANHPFIRESLDVLGVPAEKIVQQSLSKAISCAELVCFDSFWFCDFFANPHILQEVRDALLAGMDPTVKLADGAAGLYIARRDTRSVKNEGEVADLLAPYGILPFAAEHMTFRQQVSLAAQSRCIVGPHGSGLTLSLFMPKDSALIELIPIGSLNECFRHIVSLLNHRYYAVPSVPRYPEREIERVEPSLSILEQAIKQEMRTRQYLHEVVGPRQS
jgi:hypothetical protein